MPEEFVPFSSTGLPLQLPASAFASFHAPLPVDQRTHEGRYVWDSSAAAAAAAAAARMHAYHHHPTAAAHGITGNNAASPSLSELQYSAQRRSSAAAAMMNGSASAADVHAYRISPYVEHLYGYPNPNLRGLSPVDTRGLPMHPDYMSGLGHRSVMSDIHGTMAPSTIGSELPFSIDGSRITTPRSGIRQGRKRALSSSPYSDLDLMIRHSPNSLLNISLMNGSRSASSASGSYGHLSAGAISPALGVHSVVPQFQQLQHLIRQGTIPASSFLSHGSLMHHQSAGLTASQQSLLMSQQQSQVDQMLSKEHLAHTIVHPSMHPQTDQRKTTKVKKEPLGTNSLDSKTNEGGNQPTDPMKDEPGDFVETNCHWEDCENEFTTQEELVKHINNDHIHVNKKSFVCRWKECSRGQKPFKAQYMLVVHMRRHTGEKPHRCTFEGCSKAYSRLENLKTHLRSHTGEKPYTCEFPGCTKAFSNASDRAKHQNRTHSNEKPYVCKAPGCTKRYTDPSSLRKHVKTVHGHEFYANKKHKGSDHCNRNGNQNVPDVSKDGDNCANDNSPRSDDSSAVKITGSLSSPSIKSEDTSSPPQQQHSPSGIDSNVVNGFSIPDRVDFLDNPISDSNISTTNTVDIIEESEWELAEADELDIPEAAMAAAVIGGALSASNSNFVQDRNSRNRINNNLQSKSRMSHLPPLRSFPGIPRRGGNHTSGSSAIQKPQADIKPLSGGQVQKKNLDNNNYSNTSRQTNVGNRRDSATSTISSFYSSMRSDNSPHPFGSQTSSRRCSDISRESATRLGILSSPYDPISPGSSRKSSNISNYQEISASMTAHLQRLHRRAIEQQKESANTANLVTQTQNMSIDNGKSTRLPKISSAEDRYTSLSCKTPLPHDVPNKDIRRASDPVRPLHRNVGTNHRPNRENSQSFNNFNRSNVLPPLNKSPNHHQDLSNNQHPNGDILLEELDENEPIETNQDLIIPDDMMNYLNQVAEHHEDDNERPASEMSLPISSVSQYADLSPNMAINQQLSPHSNNNTNNNQMLSPTYTTLQPVRTSKLPVHLQQVTENVPQSRQFYNQNTNRMFPNQQNISQGNNIQQTINLPMHSNSSHTNNNIHQGQQSMSQMSHGNCETVQQRNFSTPQIGQGNVTQAMQQVQNPAQMEQRFGQNSNNMLNYQQTNYAQCNEINYTNLQHSNHGMKCAHDLNNYGSHVVQNHNWNTNNNNNPNVGNYSIPQNYNSDIAHSMRMNNAVNNGYTHPNNQQLYNNQQCNYVSNHSNNQMCNNCGSCTLNKQNPNQNMNNSNVVPIKRHLNETNNMQQSSGNYSAQGQYQQNVMTNYCMVPQQQTNQYFDNRCSSVPGATAVPSDKKVCDTKYMMNTQPQQTIIPSQPCQNHLAMNQNNQAEIQCNDISQSCRASSKIISQRAETYQRTLEYVKQCQQVCNDGGNQPQQQNPVKKTIRRGSVSTEMSPGCKEVTSTTDMDKTSVNYGGEPLETIPRMSTLDEVLQNPPLSISPSTLLNLPNCRNDQDNESCLNTPCMESLKSVSHTPVIPSNNMVINDMNSSLAFYAEETKYLHSVKY